MWKQIGLKENIFSIKPLQIDKRHSKLLVGRGYEIDSIKRNIFSNENMIQILTGKYGIGKTSFLNILQYEVFINENKKILPCFRKIEIRNETSIDDFIKTLLFSLCENIGEYYMNSSRKMPEDINFYVKYWLGIKSEKESSGSEFETDLQLIKFRMNKNSEDNIWNNSEPLYSIKKILNIFLKKSKLDGVFFHIDNLELVEIDRLVKLLDECRDTLFSLDKVYWLLGTSNENFPNELYNRSPRFSSYVTSTLHLDYLSHNQLYQAIENRIEEYKLYPDSYVPVPIEKNLISKIYDFTNYDLRETFKIFQYLLMEKIHNPTKSKKTQKKEFEIIEFFFAKDYLVEYCIHFSSFCEIDKETINFLESVFINNIFVQDIDDNSLNKLIRENLISIDMQKKIIPTFKLKTFALMGLIGKKSKDIVYSELIKE